MKSNNTNANRKTKAPFRAACVWAGVICLLNLSSAFAEELFTFKPIADAKVISTYGNTNFGTVDAIAVQESAGRDMRSLLRFNITGLEGKTILKIKLRLREGASDSTYASWFDVRKVVGSWTETGVTWNNQPAYDTIVYGSFEPTVAPPNSSWFEVNLNPALIAGDGPLDIVFYGKVGGATGDLGMQSREHPSSPELIVTCGNLLTADQIDITGDAFFGTTRSDQIPPNASAVSLSCEGATIRLAASVEDAAYSWEDGAGVTLRGKMTLDPNNKLQLLDPAGTGNAIIVLDPGASSPKITIGGQQVLTTLGGVAPYLSSNIPIARGSGANSLILGAQGAQAAGNNSTALGAATIAQSLNQFVIGRYNVSQGSPTTWVSTDDLFIVGNGTDNTHRSNAFVVKKDGCAILGSDLVVANDTNNTSGRSGVMYLGYDFGKCNTDPIRFERFHVAYDKTELRVNIGDNPADRDPPQMFDSFVIGAEAHWNRSEWIERFRVDSAGVVSAAGPVRVWPHGDLSMGAYVDGPQPVTPKASQP
jgi:hypothetical protein